MVIASCGILPALTLFATSHLNRAVLLPAVWKSKHVKIFVSICAIPVRCNFRFKLSVHYEHYETKQFLFFWVGIQRHGYYSWAALFQFPMQCRPARHNVFASYMPYTGFNLMRANCVCCWFRWCFSQLYLIIFILYLKDIFYHCFYRSLNIW